MTPQVETVLVRGVMVVSVFSGLAVKVPAQDEAALADESATSRAPSRGRRASLRRRLR